MPRTSSRFESAVAPCGRTVDGERFDDEDDEVHVTVELDYTCGCRTVRHEYHDGSVACRIVHHNGTVLVDELLAAE